MRKNVKGSEMNPMLIVAIVTRLNNVVRAGQAIQLKMVNFIVCRFYLSKPAFNKKDNMGGILS